MTEVIVYFARAVVVVFVYGTAQVTTIVRNDSKHASHAHPRIDKHLPTQKKIRDSMYDAWAEVAEIVLVVIVLSMIGVIE
jgi:hypothetical protein